SLCCWQIPVPRLSWSIQVIKYILPPIVAPYHGIDALLQQLLFKIGSPVAVCIATSMVLLRTALVGSAFIFSLAFANWFRSSSSPACLPKSDALKGLLAFSPCSFSAK